MSRENRGAQEFVVGIKKIMNRCMIWLFEQFERSILDREHMICAARLVASSEM